MYIIAAILVIIGGCLVYRAYSGTQKAYKENTARALARMENQQGRIVETNDLESLPEPVQRYLNYVGVVGKAMPNYVSADIAGAMRFNQTKDWAAVSGSQINFFDRETRLFYLRMKMFGLPINGLHHYEDGKASMVIKVLDLFKIIENTGDIMYQSETVTFFNDMCILAPARLIDADIVWKTVDDRTVEAAYTSNGVTVNAILLFNAKGELINFISDDRYAVDADGNYENVRWSTPIADYTDFNGYRLASRGEAIWHDDEGDFSYIKLTFQQISYQ